jgi:hypothetical protein
MSQRSCGEMDIIAAFEAVVPGSSPGRSTKDTKSALRLIMCLVLDASLFCTGKTARRGSERLC